jgi:hypothetical protein
VSPVFPPIVPRMPEMDFINVISSDFKAVQICEKKCNPLLSPINCTFAP